MALAILLVALALAHTTRAFAPLSISLNWTTLSPSAVDNPAWILTVDVTTVIDDNTPGSYITSCATLGFGYASVEFGDECHCGRGLKAALDDSSAAAGAWSIQVYTVPALRPGSWAYQGCIVDTAATPAFSTSVLQVVASNLNLVNQCLQACAHTGFSFAGVENASECLCSNDGITAEAIAANETECSSVCPLPGDAGFEFCGGVERLSSVFKFVG